MPFEDLLSIAKAVIGSLKPGSLSDENLSKLGAIFPDKLVVGALDLLDRGNVIHYDTPWGHSEYEVLGSTATYSVLVDLDVSSIPYSCTCPAFFFSVLMSGTHIMCKHVLATLIGREMTLCIERPTDADDLAAIYCRLYPLPDNDSEAMQLS